MTDKNIIDAIGEIDEDLIAETAMLRNKKRSFPFFKLGSIAACILLTAVLVIWQAFLSNNTSSSEAPQANTDIGILQNHETSPTDTTDETDNTKDTSEENSSSEATETQSITPSNKDKENSRSEGTTVPAPPSLPTAVTQDTEAVEEAEKKNDPTTPQTEDTADLSEDTTVPHDPVDPIVPDVPDPVPDPDPDPDPDPNIPDNDVIPPLPPEGPVILSHPVYPVQSQYPSGESLRIEWRNERSELLDSYKSGIGNTDSFLSQSLEEFFSNSDDENLIISPVNLYMSLGMLAETTSGSSRAQILGLLGESNITSLRTSANSIWNCTYRNDGIVTALLGNSMWFDDSFVPKSSTTDILAESYYASSFWGNMGDSEYDRIMRSWLREQTKGILGNNNDSLDPESVLTVMSTLYFKADWSTPFDKNYTGNMTFKTPTGDIKTQRMYKEDSGIIYLGENFKATSLNFREGGAMWFILPDEDVSLQSLFSDAEAADFITGKAQEKASSYDTARIRLYLPKFDVSTDIDLKTNLKNLGVEDVFNPLIADFSPLTDSQIYVKDIKSSVRVRIAESGCEGAAVTTWSGGIGAAQTVDFILNRPFIFVVTSDSSLPLFVGTVNRPN